MNVRRNLLISAVLGLICLNSVSLAQTGRIEKCKHSVKGGKYKLFFESPSDAIIVGEKAAMIYILVNPKNINREYMLDVAKRINATYCKEKRLMAVIFDSREAFSRWRQPGEPLTKIVERGYYSFDRSTGKQLLEFSKSRGNPTTEVYIDFSKNMSCLTN